MNNKSGVPKTYAEKLKDPKWQKKRLEVMARDNFTCRRCACADDTLHVHHYAYRKGAAPWDYDDSELITLCQTCHKDVEDHSLALALGMLRASQVHPETLSAVSQFIRVSLESYPYFLHIKPADEKALIQDCIRLLVAALSEAHTYSLREDLM